MSTRRLIARANAKVNLALEIIGRRPDGYHNLATIFHSITLADHLEFLPTPTPEITLSLAANPSDPTQIPTLNHPPPAISTIPLSDSPSLVGKGKGVRSTSPPAPTPLAAISDNLVLRAAHALKAHTGVTAGARITLQKRIAVAAGLGGGSADAAATLVALNRLWDLRLSDADLSTIAARLGADAPFCLIGGAALATGRGDQLDPLPPLRRGAFVVLPIASAQPDKTARMFRALTPADWTDGAATRRLADRLGATDARGCWPTQLGPNGFEGAACDESSAVARALDAARDVLEPELVTLTGAGPSVIGLADDLAGAQAAVATLRQLGYNALVALPADAGVVIESA